MPNRKGWGELRPNRRGFLIGTSLILGAAGISQAQTTSDEQKQQWRIFKDRYYKGGRIIDTGNHDVSHSEGQGYGMLISQHSQDQEVFDALWKWTQKNLQHTQDSLSSWRFNPSQSNPVDDPNNATDGDLLIGMALEKASKAWSIESYHLEATKIASSVLEHLYKTSEEWNYLLPAKKGFQHHEITTLNPSYHIIPALRAMNRVLPDARWEKIIRDGQILLNRSRFGKWNLPTDWIEISNQKPYPMPSGNHPPRFGYDAIRVPLYTAWAGLSDDPSLKSIVDYWEGNPQAKEHAWIDVKTGEMSPEGRNAGFKALMEISTAMARKQKTTNIGRMEYTTDYYSASLLMLSRIVASDNNIVVTT